MTTRDFNTRNILALNSRDRAAVPASILASEREQGGIYSSFVRSQGILPSIRPQGRAAEQRYRFSVDPATTDLLARPNGVDPRLYSKYVYPNGYPALSAAPPYAFGSASNSAFPSIYPDPYAYPYLTAYPYPYGPGYGYVSTAPLATVVATPPMPLRLPQPTDGWVCYRY
jgi:hypothetical protein